MNTENLSELTIEKCDLPLAKLEEKQNTETKSTKFRIQSKSWFLTYPKCGLSKDQVYTLLAAKRPTKGGVIAVEKHEAGTPHIHVYLLLVEQYNCANARFWDLEHSDIVYHGNYQKCRNIDDVVKYIKKDGDLKEWGDIKWEERVSAKKDHRRAVAQSLMDRTKTLAEVIDEDPTLLFGARHLKQDLDTYFQSKIEPLETEAVRGIWIYGAPGVGKSHQVRKVLEPQDLYIKDQNKWWDGYTGQKAVLLEDFDKQGDCLSHFMKTWPDKWSLSAQVKGSTTPLCYERFYVTSNYHPKDIWTEDSVLCEAISRRFKIVHMLDRNMDLSDSLLVKRSPAKDSPLKWNAKKLKK